MTVFRVSLMKYLLEAMLVVAQTLLLADGYRPSSGEAITTPSKVYGIHKSRLIYVYIYTKDG